MSLEAWVVGMSAVVVLVGAVIVHRRDAPASQLSAASAAAALPPPLPSGAPPRSMEELPSDDEQDTGCHFADHGFGDYGGWRKLSSPNGFARALIPAGRAVQDDGSFRLLVHFHGAEPIRKQLAPEGFDIVIVAVDAGIGSGAYERAFPPGTWEALVSAIEREVATVHRVPGAHAGPIVVSSWSAGYGAVTQILTQREPRLGALILLDSLYAGYPPGKRAIEHGQLAPFLDAARTALRGGPTFYLTHTAIPTPGYASTGEVASFLLAELGGEATPVEASAVASHPLHRFYEAGRLFIRGYGGSDRDAHCAQLHLLPGILSSTVLPSLQR
jgi:hypothetical protein